MRRKEGQWIKRLGALAAALACAMGVIIWLERDDSSARQADALAQAAPRMTAQAQPTPIPTPEPVDTHTEKEGNDFAASVPEPRATHIQRDISGKLRIDAEAVEPGELKMKIADHAFISYDPKTLANLLFHDKESKRSTAKWGEGAEITNAGGEVLLTGPGRVVYSRYAPKDVRSHWDQAIRHQSHLPDLCYAAL